MTRAWSTAAEEKLRRLYGREKLPRLAFLLKRTVGAVRSRAKVLGLNTGRRRRWTRNEDKTLRSRYPHERTAAIARDLGRTLLSVNKRALNWLGLHKSATYLASPDACRLRRGDNIGAPYRYPKGHVPANKGLRRPGWSVGRGRMQETQFKKGQKPFNARFAIGDTRINADGYIDRKISEDKIGANNWRALHRILWEEEHGPVPPGHVVAFNDGNKLNCVLENLELRTHAENMAHNNIWKKLPKELALIAQLKGAIHRQINKRLGRKQEKDRGRRNAARRAVRNAKRLAQQGKPDGHRAGEGSRAGG